MTYVMKQDLRKIAIVLSVGAVLLAFLNIFTSPDIVMVLQRNGYNVPMWVGDALTTISTVYGAQQYLLGILGVSIAPWLAGIIITLGAAGL